MAVNYGTKRVIVGAHYGLFDWLSQRITAGLMAVFTVILLAQVLFTRGPIGYDKWAGIFSSQWMKVLTFVVIASLLYHVWVGMRNIWMDYVKPVSVRLTLDMLTLAWLGVVPFLAYTTAFLLLPAGTVIVGAFQTQDGGWSFDNIQKLFDEPYRTAFKNSIEVSIVTALVGGPLFLWLVLRTRQSHGGWA